MRHLCGQTRSESGSSTSLSLAGLLLGFSPQLNSEPVEFVLDRQVGAGSESELLLISPSAKSLQSHLILEETGKNARHRVILKFSTIRKREAVVLSRRRHDWHASLHAGDRLHLRALEKTLTMHLAREG